MRRSEWEQRRGLGWRRKSARWRIGGGEMWVRSSVKVDDRRPGFDVVRIDLSSSHIRAVAAEEIPERRQTEEDAPHATENGVQVRVGEELCALLDRPVERHARHAHGRERIPNDGV